MSNRAPCAAPTCPNATPANLPCCAPCLLSPLADPAPLPALPPNPLCNCLPESHAICGPGPARLLHHLRLPPSSAALLTAPHACVSPLMSQLPRPRSICPFSSPLLSCLPLNCPIHSRTLLYAPPRWSRHHLLCFTPLPAAAAVHTVKPVPPAAFLSFHYSHQPLAFCPPPLHIPFPGSVSLNMMVAQGGTGRPKLRERVSPALAPCSGRRRSGRVLWRSPRGPAASNIAHRTAGTHRRAARAWPP